ncbi:PepSY domain-containing protein [Methylocapsa sp. D3K7]|uniref:PepSY-associated TM helix domain-containing protein n=1 Tax=Methylocapsa sp. D3K7 TaxID=3041435 RepID=UPI003297F7C3
MRANIAIRRVFVWLHHWVGLAMTGFLVLVGLTGSLLAFNNELERLISPQLFATSRPDATLLDLGALAARAENMVPEAQVQVVSLTASDQAVAQMMPRTNPATEKPYQPNFDQLFLDPGTGEELGRRMNGDITQGWINFMPFIYDLHWRLALGTTGFWILGIAALAWTIGCFIGFYLTLPVAIENFWVRWKPGWLVKWRAGLPG